MLEKHGQDYIDVLFIDHDKKMYLDDLCVIEKAGILRTGMYVYVYVYISYIRTWMCIYNVYIY